MGTGAFGGIEPNRFKIKWGSETLKITYLKGKIEEKGRYIKI